MQHAMQHVELGSDYFKLTTAAREYDAYNALRQSPYWGTFTAEEQKSAYYQVLGRINMTTLGTGCKMTNIDTESLATERAVAFLRSLNVSFARCIGAVRLPKGQTPIWESLFDHKLADDTWLWQVSFEGKSCRRTK